MSQGQGPAVALTNVYAEPHVPPRSAPGGRRKGPGPRWYWALLGAGWVGAAALAGVVLWLLQRRGGDCPILQQDTAPCSWETCLTDASRHPDVPQTKCSLDCFRLQLRQQLCERGSHHPAGPLLCWLCPAGWRPFAAKCYWVSTKSEAWGTAAADCAYWRAQLVRLESLEEKTFIGEMLGNASTAWTGLSFNQSGEKEWTWQDGSPLQKAL
ncbi:killer cell lectin-like receptor subfamily F member 1 isoform X3 [Rissa tridactyla]|uniref:killer cell lectin-like receptor subfamily F member 1 isoform X3 n=1 Tax=Rissa tridactyla TaxID=75485 RepID=UPI0023BB149F|nr:killer cell lectin-like receptor subfamily F member 1 isoform X3 [Rissa tridactyla]